MNEHFNQIGAKVWELEQLKEALITLAENSENMEYKRLLFFMANTVGNLHESLAQQLKLTWQAWRASEMPKDGRKMVER